MRVDVDEAGRDDAAGGVERARARQVGADRGDALALDRDVRAHAGRARSVDHGAAADHELGHGVLLLPAGCRSLRSEELPLASELGADHIIDPSHYQQHGYPYETFARLRREDPVHRCAPAGVEPFWAITRHADICEISRSPERFSSATRP